MKRISFFLMMILVNMTFFVFAQYDEYIYPKYEMRGAWVATVVNIDWPSKKGLSVEEQKAEYIRIVEEAKRMKLNALFVQIRPAADAFYPSQYDPWSEFLTGTQGQYPGYDPLSFMIEETHKRGIEFHAWLNPYRAVFDVSRSSVSSNHVTKRRPELFFTYGKGKIFDPGLPETRQYFVGVVRDIINRYAVDGIHLDDYFYPYKVGNKDYPDDATYRKYGGNMKKADWRRANCDSIIKQVHEAIVQTRPMIRFGVSPFGIYKNKYQDADGSNTRGTTNYHDLYADIVLWLKNGWIDYVAPQLYWPIGKDGQDFNILLDWWSKNTYGKQLYIGQAIYNANSSALWRNKSEIPNQIKQLRKNTDVHGSVFFSFKNLQQNANGWRDSLQYSYYKKPAIVPPMSWIDNKKPFAPEIWCMPIDDAGEWLHVQGALNEIAPKEKVKSYVLYYTDDFTELGHAPQEIIVAENANQFSVNISKKDIPAGWKQFYIVCTSLDKENNESVMSNIIRVEKKAGQWKAYHGFQAY